MIYEAVATTMDSLGTRAHLGDCDNVNCIDWAEMLSPEFEGDGWIMCPPESLTTSVLDEEDDDDSLNKIETMLPFWISDCMGTNVYQEHEPSVGPAHQDCQSFASPTLQSCQPFVNPDCQPSMIPESHTGQPLMSPTCHVGQTDDITMMERLSRKCPDDSCFLTAILKGADDIKQEREDDDICDNNSDLPDDEVRKESRKEQNRRASRKYRAKQRDEDVLLKQELMRERSLNVVLQTEVEELRNERQRLTCLLRTHLEEYHMEDSRGEWGRGDGDGG